MFENDGSNALKQYPLVVEEPTPRRQVRPAPKKSLSPRSKLKIVAAVGVAFVMLLTVLMMYASLNSSYRRLNLAKTELDTVSAKVERISSEIEGAGGIASVEEKAVEMGLHQADSSQIVYISLEDADKGRVLAEDNGNTGLNLFLNKIAAIAEYLY